MLRTVFVVLGIVLVIVAMAFLMTVADRVVSQYLFSRPEMSQNSQPLNLKYEKVEFLASDGIRLVGWFMSAENSLGTVIVASGFQYNRDEVIKHTLFLNQAGYNLFVFDPRGQGESEGVYALGSKESEDIEGTIKWLKESKRITKVALLGYSCGATAALIAASENRDSIVAVIADSPFANLSFWGPKITDRILGAKIFLPIYNFIASIRLGYNFFRSTNALRVIGKVSNVFFIHGKKDKTVSYQSTLRLFEKAKPPKEIWLTDVGHIESIHFYPKEYAKKVLSFLREHSE